MDAAVYWATSVAALLGVWLNIKRHVACFYIWAVTNAVWVYADATHGLTSQASLQAVYFLLAIYGIACWSKKATTETSHVKDPR